LKIEIHAPVGNIACIVQHFAIDFTALNYSGPEGMEFRMEYKYVYNEPIIEIPISDKCELAHLIAKFHIEYLLLFHEY
jgi:hypothetical protein